MVSAIASMVPTARAIDRLATVRTDNSQLRWSRSWSLATRILAVNLFAILMLAGGILYLDSFRERLLEQRMGEMRASAALIAGGIAEADDAATRRQIAAAGQATGARVRIFAADGRELADNWRLIPPTYSLRDPADEPWRKHAARWLDRVIEGTVGTESLPTLPLSDTRGYASFPEIAAAAKREEVVGGLRFLPDRTHLVSAAAPLPNGNVVLVSADARDITTVVRAERSTLFFIFLGVLALSLLLSSFLARTIVRPLRRLAIAAQRVRLGRSREVTVPRFQLRKDEIGALARSLSDMTGALRMRIDGMEAFAADVSHEIKNPLASLRSAIEGLERITDPELRAQLLAICADDVQRIDRLVTDISDASRLDAELSRAHYDPVDLAPLLERIVAHYEDRGLPRNIQLALARPAAGTAIVMGAEQRLAQVVRNLVDNAISFSPDNGIVEIGAARGKHSVIMRVDDRGPGIPEGAEEKIFDRFYSERPGGEAFGKHSGLGLAISRAIVEAHDGTLTAQTRRKGGASFTITLPVAP